MAIPKCFKFPLLIIFASVQVLFSCANSEQKSDSLPNIIVILADDQGYGTMECYGGDPLFVQTPNLEKFAREGARFTNAYVTCSTCSPSRAGLITGRYQQRIGYYANIDGQRGTGLPADAIVFPTYLKNAGYRTAAIGKWHLGVKLQGQHPLDRGFDVYYGFNSAQTDYFDSPILYNGREKVESHEYLTTQFTKEAISFISQESDEPFFLYLAYNAVHGPNQVPEEYIAQFSHIENKGERKQAAMLKALDDGVGDVMQALKETGQDNNTLVFYLSDNGGLPTWWESSNAPLRGYKRQQTEGGNRVVFMMRWPGEIESGQVRHEIVHSLDIAPTALKTANVSLPEKQEFDGVSILPLLNKEISKEIHSAIFWAGSNVERRHRYMSLKELPYPHDDPPPSWAVRRGKWKLMHIFELGDPMLFDLETDIAEEQNLIGEYPEIAEEMRAMFVEWFKEMEEPIAWDKKYYEQLKAIQ